MNKKNNKNVLNFPNLLNNGTILIILVAYIVLVLSVVLLFIPKNNYTSVPEYSHTITNSEVSSYLKLSTSLIADKDGNVEPKQTVNVYLNNNSTEEKEILVNYEISGLTNQNTMDYLYSGSRNSFSSLPVVHTLVSDKSVAGGNYKKLFGKIIYEINNEENELTKNVYKFSETMLTLSKKEKNSDVSNKTMLKDVVSITLLASKSSDADYYSTSTSVSIKVPSSLYHLDYQSWIVTEEGKVYPLVGYYNVSYTEKPTLTSTNKISTSLNAKYVIVKAIATNSYGVSQTFFYKELFENIVR